MWAIQKPLSSFFLKKITTEQNITFRERLELPSFLNPARNWKVKELDIEARAALTAKIDSGGNKRILFKKAEKEKLAIASLTKLMTAMIVLKNYDLSEKVKITKEVFEQEKDNGNLKKGDILSVKDLLYVMLIESSNNAAVALSKIKGEREFRDLMNLEAKNLNLKNTYFGNPTGLDPEHSTTTPTTIINYSNAEDLVKLTQHLLENYPLIWQITSQKEYNLYTPDGKLHHKLENTNQLLGEVPSIVGGKTGWTWRAGDCLLLVLKSPRTKRKTQKEDGFLINVILNSPDRFEEMKKLINWVRKAYKWY